MRYEVKTLKELFALQREGLDSQDRVVIHFNNHPPIRFRAWDDGFDWHECDEAGNLLDNMVHDVSGVAIFSCGPGLHRTAQEAVLCGNHVRNELDEERTARWKQENREI